MKKIEFNQSLGHLFHIINLNMRRKLEVDIKKYGLTSSHQFGILLLLSKKNLSQKEISNSTLADEPSTTRMLDRMIKNGYINKNRSDKDKRKQVISINENGSKLLKSILPTVINNNKNIENILEKEELAQLFIILNKIKSNI